MTFFGCRESRNFEISTKFELLNSLGLAYKLPRAGFDPPTAPALRQKKCLMQSLITLSKSSFSFLYLELILVICSSPIYCGVLAFYFICGLIKRLMIHISVESSKIKLVDIKVNK